MFAGRMKLKNFVVLAALSGAAAIAGLGWWITSRPPAPMAVAPPSPPPSEPPIDRAPPVEAPTGVPPDSGREIDRVVLDYFQRNIGTDKLKDVTKGRPFKINVYQDPGQKTANRAKVDLDRDDKWDEKLSLEDGRITRQVAPDDDEAYRQTFHWNGSGWEPTP